jgi:riboflavin synthase
MYFCVMLGQILCLSLLLCIGCDILMALSIVTPNSRPRISYLIFSHTRSLLFDALLHENTDRYVRFLQRKVNRIKC